MARRGNGKKMNLGEFLGDNTAAYIPEAALPSGPRVRTEGDDDRFGGRGGYGERRGYERESSRSEQSDQWRGDRFGGDRGVDRFGGDRFGSRRDEDGGSSWRGGGRDSAGPSRYDRPSYESQERPAHMRLNLQRRGDAPSSPRAGGGLRREEPRSSDDKFGAAFGSRGGMSGSRFGSDRFGDDRRDRFGDDRRGGDRFGGDRFGDDRRGGYSSSRFGRDEPRDDRFSSAFGNMRVSDDRQQQQQAAPAEEPVLDKKARAQQLREERKKKAEEERLAAEEAKRVAAEEKKKKEEEAAKQAEVDRKTMQEVLASGKKGDALAAVAKDVFAKLGRPSGAAVVESVTAAAEDVAKASANWIALTAYGALLKLSLEGTDKTNQLKALYALQVFLNGHDFPKGLLEKCFMALYSLDIVEDAAFFEYKYDVDSDVPGRMKAIIQTSTWLTWLETPEEESDEEDDE
ncbi:putative cleavage-induced protein, partial [Globisporangium splendens]